MLVALSIQNPKQAYWAALLAIIGSLAGSLVLFFIARKGGEVFLAKHVQHGVGARLHLWFQRYGLITVFVPALSPIPMPMKIPVFCAGGLQVRAAYFIVVVLLARTIRYFGLAYLGQRYGQQAFQYLRTHGWQVGLGALAIGIAASIAVRLVQKRQAARIATDR